MSGKIMVSTILNIPFLISVSVFLVLFLFVVAIYQYIRQNARERELIAKVRESGENRIIFNEEKSSSETEDAFKNRILNYLFVKGSVFEQFADYTQTRTRLLRAGVRKPNAPALFWATKFLFAFSLSVFFFIGIIFLKPVDASMKLLISVFLGLSGYFLPDIWLQIKASVRKNKILKGIPDMLDLLVVCVEAGMGLDSAIYRVAQEIRLGNKVLADELDILNLEIKAGKSREKALRNLSERIDIEDVRSLVTVLIQTNKFGTSVAKSLRVFSDSFRTKRYQKAEELAAKVPVKLMLPLILFIFPALFFVIMGPAAIRVYHTFLRP